MAELSGSGAYCRKCGYDLRGLPESRCPECGHEFDLTDSRSFRRAPHTWLLRWARRAAMAGVLCALCLGAGIGWLYWGWKVEQPAVTRLRGCGVRVDVRAIGPWWVRATLPAALRPVLERVDRVSTFNGAATEQDLLAVGRFSHLRVASLDGPITDQVAARLSMLAGLQELYIHSSEVAESAPQHLWRLTKLRRLVLSCPGLSSDTLPNSGSLAELEFLSLGVRMRPGGLAKLGALPKVRLLKLIRCEGLSSENVKELQQWRALERVELGDDYAPDVYDAFGQHVPKIDVMIHVLF